LHSPTTYIYTLSLHDALPIYAHGTLLLQTDRLLEGIALDVLHQREMERHERQDPPLRARLGHGVVHFPVLVADRRRRRAREVEEIGRHTSELQSRSDLVCRLL